MSELLSILEFSLSVTGPIFLLMGLGVRLRRIGMLTDAFVNSGSEVVFKIALPSLLLISVLKADIGQSANLPLVGYGLAATVAIFVGLEVLSSLLVHSSSLKLGLAEWPLSGNRYFRSGSFYPFR